MDNNDVILLVDVKCPNCGRTQAYSNLELSSQGERICKNSSCKYIMPEIYIGQGNNKLI